jgi:hypothetical protein
VEQVLPGTRVGGRGSGGGWAGGGTMYTQVSKCKYDKIKEEKKLFFIQLKCHYF